MVNAALMKVNIKAQWLEKKENSTSNPARFASWIAQRIARTTLSSPVVQVDHPSPQHFIDASSTRELLFLGQTQ